MQCPVCKSPMVILELNQVEIDFCPACKGIWLDRGELGILTGSDQSMESSTGFRSGKTSAEKKYRCPVCNAKMAKVEFYKTGITIDKCKKNHGLWFDKGELDSLIKLHSDAQNPVLELINDLFNKD